MKDGICQRSTLLRCKDFLHVSYDSQNRSILNLKTKASASLCWCGNYRRSPSSAKDRSITVVRNLVNEEFDLNAWGDNPVVLEAYSKACRWYTSYRSVLNAILERTPLPLPVLYIDTNCYRGNHSPSSWKGERVSGVPRLPPGYPSPPLSPRG